MRNDSSNNNEFPSLQADSLALDLGSLIVEQNLKPCPAFLKKIPIAFARDHEVLAYQDKENRFVLAKTLKTSRYVVDQMRRSFDTQLVDCLVKPEDILAQINIAYEKRDSQTSQVISSLVSDEVDFELNQQSVNVDLLDSPDRAPIVNLVNSILFDAINQRASDIHIQPLEEILSIRFRIDGRLFDQFVVPKGRQEELLSRVKIVGKMNIAEKRLPQDGRATVRVGARVIDLRVASIPSVYGERIVIRLLDKSARLYSLAELGMDSQVYKRFNELIHLEHGIILVTGPTGSGKSTTLYAALQEINVRDRNIVTLEDPVEYQLDGISQTQINEKKGMTFASGLRSVLRQDPDVIMVGEIRDEDTAKMAIQSSLTGHIVFSTLHTNDSSSAITRLLDLGIEPYLVASSVVGVLAQRLVRTICKQCREPLPMSEYPVQKSSPLVEQVFADGTPTLFRGRGCERCRETGFYGRVGLFELLIINETIRNAIQQRANASEIRALGQSDGVQLMHIDGVNKIRTGVTTLDEVLRVSQRVTD